MGHHFVPQQYLRAWESPEPGMILTYDKKNLSCKLLPIKAVAQAAGFYKAEVEAELAARLEGPANIILDDLRNLRPITEEQRIHFAIYTATMIKRVPRRRRVVRQQVLPNAIESTMNNFLTELQVWASTTTNRELAERRLKEVEQLRTRFLQEPPKEITDQIDSPWPTTKMIEAVAAMAWRLVITQGPQFFITSDNPAFFFEGLGVGTPEGEIAFPLSPTVALMGSNQGTPASITPIEVKQKIVREVNRRMCAGAERSIFTREHQPWLLDAMKKQRPYLSRIGWNT
jgi:Protein of unknown function (DUF4238)